MTTNDKDYKGPRTVTAAIGGGDIYGSIGAVIGAIAGTAWAAIAKKPKDRIVGAAIGAAAGGALGFVAGAVDGAQSAKAGEEQHDDLVKQRDRAVIENEVLHNTLNNQQTWVERIETRSTDKSHHHER